MDVYFALMVGRLRSALEGALTRNSGANDRLRAEKWYLEKKSALDEAHVLCGLHGTCNFLCSWLQVYFGLLPRFSRA